MSRAVLLLLALGLASSAAAQPMATDAAPAFGTLSPGQRAASVSFEARTSTELTLDEPGCFGYADPSAPDVVVTWGGGDLRVWVQAAFDATMLVHGPNGWACDDDTQGILPVVDIRSAPAGRYAVWLASFAPDVMDAAVDLHAGTPPPPPVLDLQGAPLAGTLDARGGFEASQGSLTLSATAGGPDAVDALGLGSDDLFCTGYINAGRPTAALSYDADGGTGILTIGATSEDADLVLVVVGPDGTYCNDDFNGTDPFLQIEDPASGRYAVWAGTFSATSGTAGAMLTVGETEAEQEFIDGFDDFEQTPYSEGIYVPLDLDTMPSVRITGTDTDAGAVAVTVAPTAPNPVQGAQCAGYVETAPTAGITLNGDGPFALTASSDSDLTLLVRTPSGGWFCSDDADGLDPGIQIDAPEAGLYLAWIGSFGDFGDGSSVDATLSATPGELVVSSAGGFEGEMYQGVTQSDGEYDGSAIVVGPGGVALTAGASQTADVMAGGDVLNPVVGEACYGFLSERPSATVDADGEITVLASSNADLTLVVRAPNGTWVCSDDADGSDPAATIDGGPGTYSVWVGTYSRPTTPVSASLRIE